MKSCFEIYLRFLYRFIFIKLFESFFIQFFELCLLAPFSEAEKDRNYVDLQNYTKIILYTQKQSYKLRRFAKLDKNNLTIRKNNLIYTKIIS